MKTKVLAMSLLIGSMMTVNALADAPNKREKLMYLGASSIEIVKDIPIKANNDRAIFQDGKLVDEKFDDERPYCALRISNPQTQRIYLQGGKRSFKTLKTTTNDSFAERSVSLLNPEAFAGEGNVYVGHAPQEPEEVVIEQITCFATYGKEPKSLLVNDLLKSFGKYIKVTIPAPRAAELEGTQYVPQQQEELSGDRAT